MVTEYHHKNDTNKIHQQISHAYPVRMLPGQDAACLAAGQWVRSVQLADVYQCEVLVP